MAAMGTMIFRVRTLLFLPGVQANPRRSSASLPHPPAHRTRQGAACQAKSIGDPNRIGGRLQRDEFLHRGIPQGHRTDADRLSPEPFL